MQTQTRVYTGAYGGVREAEGRGLEGGFTGVQEDHPTPLPLQFTPSPFLLPSPPCGLSTTTTICWLYDFDSQKLSSDNMT